MKIGVIVLGSGLICSMSFASLNLSTPRGESTTRFKTPNGKTEVCVIPKKLTPNEFSDKDRKEEQELCSFDFYGIKSDSNQAKTMVICPKQNSTNPGVLVAEIPEGMTKQQAEARLCRGPHDDLDVQAKLKSSITCSHGSAGLAYYQFSRMLNAGRVPVAVSRTMERSEHRKIINLALEYSKGQSIEASWKRFDKASDDDRMIFDNSEQMIYGNLSANPKKESFYAALYQRGDRETRYERTFQLDPFLRLKDGRSVPELVRSNDLKAIIPTVVQMKDLTDMILLDVLFTQEDRIGNIHMRFAWYAVQDGKIVSEKSKTKAVWNKATKVYDLDIPKKEREKLNTHILVREILMKDNDCGINVDKRTNMMRKIGALESIRHMSAETYTRFMQFAKIADTPEIKNWMMNEMLFSAREFAGTPKSFLNNVKYAQKTLLENCRAGLLKLDLNLQDFAPGATPTRTSCEI